MIERKQYKYSGFGLKILSEIEFPELVPDSFDKEDVSIILGIIPDEMRSKVNPEKSSTFLMQQDFILNIPSVGYYYSSNGNMILVEPHESTDESSLRLFLLSNAFAAILVQRNMILLHASSILHDKELILFLGDSGAGKSSTVAELIKRGYKLFSDDICVLKPMRGIDNKVEAYSSYAMMKLWDDTITILDDEQFEKKIKIRPEMDKYSHFFHSSFDKNAYPIKKIFILNPVNEDISYQSRTLSGIEAFEWLGKNTYRRQFIFEQEMQKIHLQIISGLIQSTEIILLNRSKENSRINTFTDYLEKIF